MTKRIPAISSYKHPPVWIRLLGRRHGYGMTALPAQEKVCLRCRNASPISNMATVCDAVPMPITNITCLLSSSILPPLQNMTGSIRMSKIHLHRLMCTPVRPAYPSRSPRSSLWPASHCLSPTLVESPWAIDASLNRGHSRPTKPPRGVHMM